MEKTCSFTPILLFWLKYLPILLAEFLTSFCYLFCSKLCWQNLSSPSPDQWGLISHQTACIYYFGDVTILIKFDPLQCIIL